MAAAELGVLCREGRAGPASGSWCRDCHLISTRAFTQGGSASPRCYFSFSNDLQSKVGESLTSLAVLSAEETPGSVEGPSLRVVWAHTASPLLCSSEYWEQLRKSIFRSLFGLFSLFGLKTSYCHCETDFAQEIRCRLFFMQCLISVPDPTVLLSRWNPVVMESICDVIPKFLCSH